MNHPELDNILDDYIGRIRAGERPASLLAENPATTEELAPLLDLSASLQALPPVKASPEAFASGKESLLATATAVFPPASPFATLKQRLLGPLSKETTRMQLLFRATALTLFLFIFGSGLAVAAAGDSLPGDTLYPVKRSWESTRLGLTWDPVARQSLETEFQNYRRQEVESLMAAGRTAVVEFEGLLQNMAGQEWLVDGMRVQLNDDTTITGNPVAGRPLHVRARISGQGELLALTILAEDTDIPDPIHNEGLPPTPTATHHATATCDPAHCNQHTPTPQATATQHHTHTPQPTTPHATATPHHTHTPHPTATPHHTHTPHPTATPHHTQTPHPTATCDPANCNQHTPTPHATATPHHTHTPHPTATPHHTQTPQPTATCDPANCNQHTPTPHATATPYYTPTPHATATPHHTYTPQPTATCDPANCNQHTPTPHATATPHHTQTPQPTATCAPANCGTHTPTPHPTATNHP